jgi:hypothetical protein
VPTLAESGKRAAPGVEQRFPKKLGRRFRCVTDYAQCKRTPKDKSPTRLPIDTAAKRALMLHTQGRYEESLDIRYFQPKRSLPNPHG